MIDIGKVLGAIQAGMGVVKTVVQTAAVTPGLNAIPYIQTVSAAVTAIDAGIKAGVNIMPFVESLRQTFGDGVPPPEKLDELNAKIAELEALADAPLPPKEDGEPD